MNQDSNNLDQYITNLDAAFNIARGRAMQEADRRNEKLPRTCRCGVSGYVPGLPCPSCGHQDKKSPWLVVSSNEFGYQLVPIFSHRKPVANFYVEA